MARNPLREIVQESLQKKADIQNTFYGYLGDAVGTVIVPGKENYVYVTLSDGMVAQAYNTMAPPILNFPVVVGFDPKQARSDLLRVLAVRDIPRIGKQDSAYHTDAHHVSHEWLNAQGGTDTVYVQLRQFMPLRPTPIAPYSVNIARDVQMIGTTWQTVGAETIDLSSYVPRGANQELFIVLSLNPTTGAIDLTSGSLVAAGSATMASIPAAPTGNYPICAVRLYTNQVKIIEARSATDLIDLRWGVFASNALLHNALGGLNTDDYQHLTAAQLVVVQNTSGSNTGDQVVPVTTGSAPNTYLNGYSAVSGSFTSGSFVVPIAKAPVANYYLTGYDGVSGSFASGSVVGGGGGGGGHVIQDNGIDMPAQPNLNILGATITNDVSGSATKIEITSGSGGGANFLYELNDVAVDGSQTDGQALVWSSGSSVWYPGGFGNDGWFTARESWSFVSADAPTFVYSTDVDVSGIYSPGMRISYSQSGSTAYGIITAISGSVVTFYGGTDYVMSGSAITNPKYSSVKAPFGFPLNPAKWTVRVTDTSSRNQATPVQNTYYNLGGVTITVPIGIWNVGYIAMGLTADATAGIWTQRATLSTSGSTASDGDFTSIQGAQDVKNFYIIHQQSKVLTILTKTPYYLNLRCDQASLDNMYFRNDLKACNIYAVCSYL